MWLQLVVFVVLAVISIAMQPKAPGVKPAALSEIEVPLADEGVPVSVVFGTVVVQSPNVVWYGDLAYVPVYSGGK